MKKGINTNIDFEFKSPVIKNIFIFFIIFVLLIFCGYHIFALSKSNSAINTQTALLQTVYKNVSTQGIVLRKEEYVNNSHAGTVVPAVPNGSKVSAGDPVVNIYTSEAQAKRASRISEIEADIKYYNGIMSNGVSTVPADINLYKQNVLLSLSEFTSAVNKNSLSEINKLSMELRESIAKQQIAVGADFDVSAVLASLQSEYDALINGNDSHESVISQSTGYFVNCSDGYENIYDFSSAKNITNTQLNELLNMSPSEIPAGNVGKIITEFNWYLVCNVSSKDVYNLKTSNSVKVLFSEESVGELVMEVVSLNFSDDGNDVTLVLKSKEMNEKIAALRMCNVKICTEEYYGFAIPQNAVRTVNNETGVYVKLGNIVRFRRINIIYSDNDIIIAYDDDLTGHLKLYDEIITEGTDLYDGKSLI